LSRENFPTNFHKVGWRLHASENSPPVISTLAIFLRLDAN
jgi:hypothetical protein